MITKKRIEVVLDEKEVAFIKELQEAGTYGDDISFNEVIKRMFYLQLREDMDTYEDGVF